ncbi:MAG: ABC transporter ATP-binding protein [Nocardioides sp.]
MLVLDGVSAGYRSANGADLLAVDSVSLTIGSREILGLVGESGCGKTTLGRVIVGLHPQRTGSVHLAGVARSAASPMRREDRRTAQMVFQNPLSSLDSHRTVGSALSEALRLGGRVPRQGRPARIEELLGLVGLEPEIKRRRPPQLSGGQCQRVAIARALAVEPQLLVCDEPVTALDVSVQARVLNLLMDLRDQLSMSCVFITHDLAVLAQLADRIAVMHESRLVEIGTAYEMLSRPRHPQTRKLLNAIPRYSRHGPEDRTSSV